ncbi:TPA: phage protein NinX family protein [Providencia alcalifaciens]
MNKYTELSDFEVNKNVAEKLGLDYWEAEPNIYVDDYIYSPCANPIQAMTIIIENKIGLSPMYHSNKWTADCLDYDFISVNKNPLRACMEVFLMKKDAENEC